MWFHCGLVGRADDCEAEVVGSSPTPANYLLVFFSYCNAAYSNI